MKKIILLSFIVLTMGAAASGETVLSLSEKSPFIDTKTTVTLTGVDDPGIVTLFASYRPNSETQVDQTVGRFDEDGRIEWVPQSAGIVSLVAKAPDGVELASENVAASFPSFPISGIVVIVVAGILLFGGAGLSLRLALKEEIV